MPPTEFCASSLSGPVTAYWSQTRSMGYWWRCYCQYLPPILPQHAPGWPWSIILFPPQNALVCPLHQLTCSNGCWMLHWRTLRAAIHSCYCLHACAIVVAATPGLDWAISQPLIFHSNLKQSQKENFRFCSMKQCRHRTRTEEWATSQLNPLAWPTEKLS